MTKTIEAGVFIPVGNHGWITSVNAPSAETGSFERVREVVKGAEALGFDFVLSPAIWRGRKGPSGHWTRALESLTTSAALLEATSRISVFSTVHMTVYPPATIAKMVATLDQIGPGRVGLNLVTGSSYLDLAHLGLWNDLGHDERYDLADEWIQLVKKLWTEESVDYTGKFFETQEAQMGPKPSCQPQLVNAGASPRGFRFAADNCDIAFFPVGDDPKMIDTARQGKALARDLGNPDLKSFGLVTLIPGQTDEEAQARLEFFNEGVDREALDDVVAGYQQNQGAKGLSAASLGLAGGEKKSSVPPGELVGSYETLAQRLAAVITECELDGVMVRVPDFVTDLTAVAEKTFSRMADYGITCRVGGVNESGR